MSVHRPPLHRLPAPPEIRRQLRAVFAGTLAPRSFPQVESWLRRCYHEPRMEDQILAACNALLDAHGIEVLHGHRFWSPYFFDIEASFVNMGDMYVTTVIRDHRRGIWRIISVGQLVESCPRRFR